MRGGFTREMTRHATTTAVERIFTRAPPRKSEPQVASAELNITAWPGLIQDCRSRTMTVPAAAPARSAAYILPD
jgi:hypothetical protein